MLTIAELLNRQRILQNLRARSIDGSLLMVAAALLIVLAVFAGSH
jgi:hypothetical protein